MDVVLGKSHSGRIIRSREAGILDALPFDSITLGSGQLFKVRLVEDALGQPIWKITKKVSFRRGN